MARNLRPNGAHRYGKASSARTIQRIQDAASCRDGTCNNYTYVTLSTHHPHASDSANGSG